MALVLLRMVRSQQNIAKWGQTKACDWVNTLYSLCLVNGIGVSPNAAETAKWFKIAAHQDSSASQCIYGRCLEAGIGVSRDVLQAVKYCEMAADQRLEEGYRAYAPLWNANRQ
jgi:TPR repeat protein